MSIPELEYERPLAKIPFGYYELRDGDILQVDDLVSCRVKPVYFDDVWMRIPCDAGVKLIKSDVLIHIRKK